MFPTKETIEMLRTEYPDGTRVRLVKMDDVTRSRIIEDLKFLQKEWRGYEEKPVKDAQEILDAISELFGKEVASE